MISPSQRPLPDNTQNSKETDTLVPGGIRTHSPSKGAAAFPRLRSRGQLSSLVTYLQFQWIKPCNVLPAQKIIYIVFVCLFSWRYNSCGCILHSPVAGFSLQIIEVSWSHTTTHHSRQDSSRRVINSSQRPLPDNTQHSQQTNIHVPGGIRTHNFSGRTAVDLRLRLRGHWDRQFMLCSGN